MKRNLTYSCIFSPLFHEHSLSLELPRTTCLLKTSCMCNRNNAHDVDIFSDEKITTRSEPRNQAKTKTNIAKGFKTYLNGLKNYLTIYHGFKIRLVILKILGKYWYILNNNTPYSDIYFLNICYTLNPWEHMPLNIKTEMKKIEWDIFWKIYFGQNIFQWQLIAEAAIRTCF